MSRFLYTQCRLCPRECGVNRLAGERGVCGETAQLRLSSAGLHFGEEPPLTGHGGSGTLFLSGCSMRCPFCQNHQISHSGMGRVVEEKEFLDICMALADAGAENLNLVTPSHMAPTLAALLSSARKKGLTLPIAWNSSGYETVESISLIEESVDIWLPDLKTLSPRVAESCYGQKDYPEAAKASILAMAEKGDIVSNSDGRLRKGLMVRHLVLPGELESTREVLRWFAAELSGRSWLSLMTQYTPVHIPGESRAIPERQLNKEEYERILGWLDEFGIDDGFIQELVPGDDWLPDFLQSNPFSSDLSRILWKWDVGFLES